MSELFRRFSINCSNGVGSYWAFLLALLVVLAWVISGPLFDYSDTWQLIINTATSITTFLMVFLIQSSQNREAKATQLKLDELIRALDGARTKMVNIENLCDEDLQRLRNEFEKIGHTTGMEGMPPEDSKGNKA
ncbi:low affinity iron permease family protein [Herminiimonas glaciei]|uniref:Low affinity iron permease family protein n=1 Tax=Herminiimonas glaciei TaxID=523788 RepID=A0ABW2I974_9BURK